MFKFTAQNESNRLIIYVNISPAKCNIAQFPQDPTSWAKSRVEELCSQTEGGHTLGIA